LGVAYYECEDEDDQGEYTYKEAHVEYAFPCFINDKLEDEI